MHLYWLMHDSSLGYMPQCAVTLWKSSLYFEITAQSSTLHCFASTTSSALTPIGPWTPSAQPSVCPLFIYLPHTRTHTCLHPAVSLWSLYLSLSPSQFSWAIFPPSPLGSTQSLTCSALSATTHLLPDYSGFARDVPASCSSCCGFISHGLSVFQHKDWSLCYGTGICLLQSGLFASLPASLSTSCSAYWPQICLRVYWHLLEAHLLKIVTVCLRVKHFSHLDPASAINQTTGRANTCLLCFCAKSLVTPESLFSFTVCYLP